MQVSIHPDLADTLIELYRNAVESGDDGWETEEMGEMYSKFCESVIVAKRRERRKQILARARKAAQQKLHGDRATRCVCAKVDGNRIATAADCEIHNPPGA